MNRVEDRSRWQAEYDTLPKWARSIIDGLKQSHAYGVGRDEEDEHTVTVHFERSDDASEFLTAVANAVTFKNALSAPFPPPPPPARERRVINTVEMVAVEGDNSDCAFDQPCCYGHRVECHAVYCHNEKWPDSPRKCYRNKSDYQHEDCPGFVANPDYEGA